MLYIGEAHLTGDPLHGVLMLSAGSCADCMSLFYLVITGAPARATLLGVAFVLALAGSLFFSDAGRRLPGRTHSALQVCPRVLQRYPRCLTPLNNASRAA